MTVENFVRTVYTVFEKAEKSPKLAVFSVIFGLILAMFLRFQSYDFDAIAHAGAPLVITVQNFIKIVWTVFEKIFREVFSERSGEKRYDCISSRELFNCLCNVYQPGDKDSLKIYRTKIVYAAYPLKLVRKKIGRERVNTSRKTYQPAQTRRKFLWKSSVSRDKPLN